MTKEPLIILTGPTAVGKTALSLSLAERVNGEIISADSMQVYRGMDIGSAKIMPEEQKGIPHHLIDVLDPDEEFHVVRFVQMAKEAMEDIRSRGKVPILTGGLDFTYRPCFMILILRKAERTILTEESWRLTQKSRGQKSCMRN